MKRIICIGNRYVRGDDAGPRVCDRLRRPAPPADLEVVDGGLAGLDLLPLLEGAERIVFVDSVRGFRPDPGIVLLDPDRDAGDGDLRYGHDSGLAFLLRVMPHVCEGPLPEILLVGVEGEAEDAAVEEAARWALRLARGGDCPGGPKKPVGGVS